MKETFGRFARFARFGGFGGLAFAAAAIFLVAFAVRASAAQARGSTPRGPAAAPRTTLSGIYTEAQATKGEEMYYAVCIACHAKGTYAGPGFKANWAGKPLSDLYDWVLNKMPKNDPGSLTPAESVEVIAYILQQNKMPAGKTPLPANANQLYRIRIQLK
jgi:mono/diheme cytochrome c family protein